MNQRIINCPACSAKLRVRPSENIIALLCPRCSERVEVDPADGIWTVSGMETDRQPRIQPGTGQPPGSPPAGVPRGTVDSNPIREPSVARELIAVAAVLVAILLGAAGSLWWILRSGGAADNNTDVAQTLPSAITEPAEFPAEPPNLQPPDTATSSSPSFTPPTLPPSIDTVPPGFAQVPPPSLPTLPPQTPPPFQPPVPPAPANIVPAPAVPSAPHNVPGRRLMYGWKPNTEHTYQFSIDIGPDDDRMRTSGSCSYFVKAPVQAVQSDDTASGTGFIVASDGLIATCAHVIEGASKVTVQIAERNYEAIVIAVNVSADLALLRVNAQGLTPLPLIDSDSLQLAEPVLAVGYPLSDVLGTEVKVTTGSIAGLTQDNTRGRRIQIDAALNPGNSGGPIVNAAGQVLGVAAAKLSGEDVTSVGFAAPINELRSLAATHGIILPLAARDADISRSEAAKRTTPSVVMIRAAGLIPEQLWKVDFTSSYTTMAVDKVNFSPPEHSSGSGNLLVDKYGHIVEFEGDQDLPAVLGKAGLLFIEPLDPNAQPSWTISAETTISRVTEPDRPFGNPFGGPFGGPPAVPFGPFGPRPPGFSPRSRLPGMAGRFGPQPEPEVEEIPAIERSNYRLGRELNNRVAISKTYELAATRKNGQQDMLIRGTGQLVFDLVSGVLSSLEYSAVIERFDGQASTKTPLTVRYSLRDPAEVRRERAEAQAQLEAQRNQEELEAKTPNPELVNQLLGDIRSAEGKFDAWPHLRRLAKLAIVEDKRSEVLKVAKNHLLNSNSSIAESALLVLVHWGTSEQLPDFNAIVANKELSAFSMRKPAVEAIASFGKTEDVLPLIAFISESILSDPIAAALVAAGASAESSVLDAIANQSDHSARRKLIEVLGKIGTEKSIASLEMLANGDDLLLKFPARSALDAIRSRL